MWSQNDFLFVYRVFLTLVGIEISVRGTRFEVTKVSGERNQIGLVTPQQRLFVCNLHETCHIHKNEPGGYATPIWGRRGEILSMP